MSDRLKNKTTIVTGAARNIGRTIAKVFADEGANVVVVDIETEGGQETVQQIRHQGGRAEFVPADVSDAGNTVSLIDSTVSLFGKLDIIVNNAVHLPDPEVGTLELSEVEWDRTLAVGLKSVFLMAKAGIPVMREAKAGGAIVNISSVNAIVTNPWYQAYSAAKAGMLGLTRNLALEFAEDRIRVNAICPGMINTASSQATPADKDEAWAAREVQPLPYWGEEKDVALAAVYLASDESKFVTGATLVVDGGLTIQSPEAIVYPRFRKRWRKGILGLKYDKAY